MWRFVAQTQSSCMRQGEEIRQGLWPVQPLSSGSILVVYRASSVNVDVHNLFSAWIDDNTSTTLFGSGSVPCCTKVKNLRNS